MGSEIITKTFDAKKEVFNDVLVFIEENLESHEASFKVITQIGIAVEELFVNVASYAYPDKTDGKCTLDMIFEGDNVSIRFIDSGIYFDPLSKPDPDITLGAEERGIGGLGIFMVKKSMDNVFYERTNDQNILTIVKKIK